MAALQGAYPTTGNYQHADVMAPAASFIPEPVVIYSPLAEGAGGTWQTLEAMRACVLGQVPPDYSGYQDPFNIRAANQLASLASGQDARSQVAALFNFAAQRITYLEHPLNQQTVQDARRTIEIGSGDCVSLSVLLATFLACLGYQSQFIAQFVDGESASHVYTEVFMPDGEIIALDPVAKDKPMGWRQSTLDGGFETPWRIF